MPTLLRGLRPSEAGAGEALMEGAWSSACADAGLGVAAGAVTGGGAPITTLGWAGRGLMLSPKDLAGYAAALRSASSTAITGRVEIGALGAPVSRATPCWADLGAMAASSMVSMSSRFM